MRNYFSIGEAAKAVRTTSETLRHYDRIGLVKPSKKDEWTNYRYYTEQDIVRLNTVRASQVMDLQCPHRIQEDDVLLGVIAVIGPLALFAGLHQSNAVIVEQLLPGRIDRLCCLSTRKKFLNF